MKENTLCWNQKAKSRAYVYCGIMWKNFRNVNNEIKIEDDVHDINPLNIKEQFTKFFEDIDEVNLPAVDKLKLFPIYCKLFQVSAYGYTIHCFFTFCMFYI